MQSHLDVRPPARAGALQAGYGPVLDRAASAETLARREIGVVDGLVSVIHRQWGLGEPSMQ